MDKDQRGLRRKRRGDLGERGGIKKGKGTKKKKEKKTKPKNKKKKKKSSNNKNEPRKAKRKIKRKKGTLSLCLIDFFQFYDVYYGPFSIQRFLLVILFDFSKVIPLFLFLVFLFSLCLFVSLFFVCLRFCDEQNDACCVLGGSPLLPMPGFSSPKTKEYDKKQKKQKKLIFFFFFFFFFK